MRYIDQQELKARTSSGKAIEQWLSAQKFDDYAILKWLCIVKERDSHFDVAYTECFDDGDEHFTDIYEFSPVDADQECTITTFDNFDDALNFAIDQYKASADQFVAAGMIQEEYLEYLRGAR